MIDSSLFQVNPATEKEHHISGGSLVELLCGRPSGKIIAFLPLLIDGKYNLAAAVPRFDSSVRIVSSFQWECLPDVDVKLSL